MTVEFLDPDPDHRAERSPVDRTGAEVGRVARRADPVLTIVGAALFVVAGFRTVFSISGGSDSGFTNYRVSGWGRVEFGISDIDARAAPVAIVLCVAAGLAVLGLGARVRLGPATRLGPALGWAAAGVAAATVGHAVLDALAARQNVVDSLGTEDPPSRRPPRLPDVEVGGFVWWGAAGLVCVLLALLVPAIVGRAARVSRPPTAAPRPVPTAPHHDDEQLP